MPEPQPPMAKLGPIPQAIERGTSLSPEWKAVLACLRAALVDRNSGGIDQDLLSSPLDWFRLADIAREHRIAPLLFRSLQRLAPTPESNAALPVLKQLYLATAARNAVLFRALETILGALTADTRVIVLKGAALADTVYPERALRPMNDIDLLVREEDLEGAEAQLQGVGYEAAHDPDTKARLRSRHHHWVFRNTRPVLSGIPLELHWRLHPPWSPFHVDLDALWERAVPSRIAGITALALGPEDFLLHLCTHAARHRFNGALMPLCDIAAVIDFHRGRIDWVGLEERAQASRSGPYVAIALQLAEELLGAAVPSETSSRLRKADDGLLLDLARERILEEKGALRAAAESLLEWRRRAGGGRLAALKKALTPDAPAQRGFANRISAYSAHILSSLRRYLPVMWSLARHPRAIEAIARRESTKSQLDAWCRAGAGETDARP